MKTEEDEAFDELARKQGMWGGFAPTKMGDRSRGFKAKQAMAADKLWDKPTVAFDEWWNGDNDESTNPFRLESGAYWAWAGWKAALAQPAQPAQEPVQHWSDCAVHNGPAYPAGECDCGVAQEPVRKVLKLALEALETERDIYCEHDEDGAPEYILDAITSIKVALAQPAQEPEMLTIAYQSGFYDGKQATLAQPTQEAIYGMNQDDWKDVVAAIAKVRDGRGIYLGCRPADVFQDWFLALGTAKVKEKNNET
jgi:hypothetical protein